MAINASNLHYRESATGPNRGGAISASTDVTVSTLFDAVSGDRALAGETSYRGVYFQNANSTSGGLQSAYVWISTQTPGADDVLIGLDAAGLNSSMAVIANFTTAPAGASFTAPANKAAGLSLGTITASTGYYGIWLERHVPSSCAAYNANSFVITVEGDSAA